MTQALGGSYRYRCLSPQTVVVVLPFAITHCPFRVAYERLESCLQILFVNIHPQIRNKSQFVGT